MLFQPFKTSSLEACDLTPGIPVLNGADVALQVLDLDLDCCPPGSDPMSGPYEAARKTGEAVTGVQDKKRNTNDIQNVKYEEEQILAVIFLQLFKKPFNFLPLR